MQNIPEVKVGMIAVSRSCFPMALSVRRREAIKAAYGEDLYECPICVENELDARKAYEDVKAAGVNALCVFLGNFGPETPETMIADWFDGPIMYTSAAEGDGDLHDGRGDAYCGMLNASYNLGLRNRRVYIPDYPCETAEGVAQQIREFVPIARAMQEELGGANPYAGVLPRLAQYELTLEDWMAEHLGCSKYAAFANKCWPAFQTEFGFVPCYVNSRLTGRGIPVSCEVDIYGTLSEYIGICVSGKPVTLLDINNSVPASMYQEHIAGKAPYRLNETFMGFHCGNTCSSLLRNPHMGYQLIMKRDLEPDLPEPDITRGTMEGDIKAGEITFYRLQSTADTQLRAYIAQGEVLDVATQSFGSIGVFAIPEMNRFYRHVLIEKRYPHHGAVAFGHYGKALFEVFKYLGVADIAYNQPKNLPYPTENPFC